MHDSGLERAHTADLADELGVPFAPLSADTTARLAALLDPGLLPANPLDVWGTGSGTRALLAGALTTLAREPAVTAVALAVDLVPELDGDQSYPLALLDAAAGTGKPLAALSNLPAAIDPGVAAQLRAAGHPGPGGHPHRPARPPPPARPRRRSRLRRRPPRPPASARLAPAPRPGRR